MKLQFDPNQDYQLEAIQAVTGLFEGEGYTPSEVSFSETGGFAVRPNPLHLADTDLLRNLQRVQSANRIPPDHELHYIQGQIESAEGEQLVQFPNFSVEMETGTGKTYVYIRTALTLAQRYGMSKFIIVVPTVAVREGVLKTFMITKAHLSDLFSRLPYQYAVYDSGNLNRLRKFADSNTIQFLIMTLASFNKDANVIRRKDRDQTYGIPALHFIQQTRPILILDEPQNFTTEQSEAALASLNPLFALRYSATHPKGKEFNRVYRLTPFEAYRRGLVKKIDVAGIERVDLAPAFIRLESLTVQKSVIKIKVTVNVLGKDGTVKQKTITITPKDDLAQKTNLPDYAQYRIREANIEGKWLLFQNLVYLRLGESLGDDKTSLFTAQIEYTIREHFAKQKRLKAHGIKALTLFFIDRVENYAAEAGIIRRIFNEVFNRLKQDHPEWRDLDAEAVQGSYFAQKKHEPVNTKGDSISDRDVYDLIMRDRESLLSFPEETDSEVIRRRKQICFIFSHSALREGWDNPNIFQICTLNQSRSEVRKRQEIGRGIRLAVNQQGERVFGEQVNILTVIANQSYEQYVHELQVQSIDDYGGTTAPPTPSNARERKVVTLNKKYLGSVEFQELWGKIKHRTRYNVKFEQDRLIEAVVRALDQMEIPRTHLSVNRGRVQVVTEQQTDQFTALQTGRPEHLEIAAPTQTSTDVVKLIAHMLHHSTPPVRVGWKTLAQLVKRTTNRRAAQESPQAFASRVVDLIRTEFSKLLIDGIQYEKTGEEYELTRFESEIQSWEEFLAKAEHCLYDHVVYHSEVERQFVIDLEKWDAVKLYVKLPSWFVVPTPIGNYTPDWAIVIEPRDSHGERTGEQYTYLVSETKSTRDLSKLRPDEVRKIKCGEAHFTRALGVVYKHVVKVQELQKG